MSLEDVLMQENEGEKKFTLASRLAIIGGFLMLLLSPTGIYLYAPRPGMVTEPEPIHYLPLQILVLCSLVTIICAVSVNYAPPKLKVALGAIIVVCSIISARFLLPYFPLLVGNVLAVIGGLWTIACYRSKQNQNTETGDT